MKFLNALFFVWLAGILTSAAQIKITDRLDFGFPERMSFSIPKEFTYSQTPFLIMHDGDDASKLLVYDENIELIKTINLGNQHDYTYQLTYQDEKREVADITQTELSISELVCNFEEFVEQTKRVDMTFDVSKLTIEKQENGDSLIYYYDPKDPYSENHQMFFHPEVYEGKYPKRFWKCSKGKMYLIKANYAVSYTEWEITKKHTEEIKQTQRLITACNINLNQGDGKANSFFEVSQTLFNQDEDFEYMIPKYVLSTKSEFFYEFLNPEGTVYGEEPLQLERTSVISEKSKLAISGIQIVSSDGKIIKDLDFEDGFVGNIDASYAYVLTIGSKTYLAFNGYVNGKDRTVFYQLNRKTSSMKKMNTQPVSMILNPTIVKQGSPIQIQLDDNNENGSEIAIFSINGTCIKSFSLAPNQTQIKTILQVPAGIYQAIRFQNSKIIETKKFMIK